MGSRALTPALYDALVEAFRLTPGNPVAAGKRVGVDTRTAKRCWEGPPYRRGEHGAFRLIKDVLAEEQAAKERAIEDQIARDARAAEERATRERLAEEERIRVEENTLRLGANVVLRGFTALAKLVPGIEKMVERVNDQLVRGTDANGAAIAISPEACLRILQRFDSATGRLVSASESLVTLARLRRGEPTAVVGLSLGNTPTTLDELEQEQAIAAAALARSRHRKQLESKGDRRVIDMPEEVREPTPTS